MRPLIFACKLVDKPGKEVWKGINTAHGIALKLKPGHFALAICIFYLLLGEKALFKEGTMKRVLLVTRGM
jgi:hypothetical protein